MLCLDLIMKAAARRSSCSCLNTTARWKDIISDLREATVSSFWCHFKSFYGEEDYSPLEKSQTAAGLPWSGCPKSFTTASEQAALRELHPWLYRLHLAGERLKFTTEDLVQLCLFGKVEEENLFALKTTWSVGLSSAKLILSKFCWNLKLENQRGCASFLPWLYVWFVVLNFFCFSLAQKPTPEDVSMMKEVTESLFSR